jgi:O-antigen ligase
VRKITYLLSLVLIFSIPWEDSVSTASIGSLARLIGIVLAGLWLGTIAIEGRFRKPHLFHALVLLFFLWNFVSIFWSSDIATTIQRIKTYSQIFLLMLIYWDIFQTREHLIAGLRAYVCGACILVFSTVYNYLSGNVAVQYEGRYSATGVNANDVVLILIIGLPIVLHLFFVTRKDTPGNILRVVGLLYLPLSIYSIILTGSRTSLVAILPFLILMAVTGEIKAGRKLLMFLALIACLLASLPFVPQTVLSRLGTIGSSIGGADLGGRVNMWWKSIAILDEHPILGVGSGAVDRAIGGAVHNTFITIVSETGFVGLLLFLSILGLVFYEVVRLPRRKAELWLTILMIWTIGILSLSWEFRKVSWILLGFMIIESSFREQVGEQEGSLNFVSPIGQSHEAGEPTPRLKVI